MGNITIHSAGGTLKATLPRVLQAAKHDSLSGEMTFSCRVRISAAPGVSPGDVLSYGGESYDVVRVSLRTAIPAPLADIACEHVSYRLNECELEAGSYTGTPTAVLGQLLSGTGFSVGTVQMTSTILLSFTETTNVRAAVMSLAAAASAEISFTGFTVNLLSRIGSTTAVELSDKKNVESLSVTLDDRSDTQSYDITLYKETTLSLGDAVDINYNSLGLHTSARVCSIDVDPFNSLHVKIVTGQYVPAFVDTVIRALNDKVALGQPYFGVTIDREHGIQIVRSDGLSQAIFNSDQIVLQALIDGVMQNRLFFNTQKGDFEFSGILSADAAFTESLYAEQGDIAELTVDRLSTSRRVRKYILGDTSDDNFIQIQEQHIQFITGTVTSQTPVQAVNRNNQPLYWQREPVSHDAAGYPFDADGVQIYATTTPSSWPVYTYTYTDLVKAQLYFALENGTYVPMLALGAGDEHGYTRGTLHKSPNGFDIMFTTSSGEEIGLKCFSAGYMDLFGLRKPTSLDFSGWSTGSFEEVLDGDVVQTFLVDFDSAGRPVLITDGEGHETEVSW